MSAFEPDIFEDRVLEDRVFEDRVEEIFSEAVEKASEDRIDFLRLACGEDEDLRSEVESLIEADEQAGLFMAHPSLHRPRREMKKQPSMPQRLGPYRLLREIGQGGAGTVFLAVRDDDAFEKKVAIKIIHLQSQYALRRFRAERQILAELDHPGIAAIYDGGTTEDGRPYFVMEWVEGEPIDVYCDRLQLDLSARLKLFQEVCSAVHSAHQSLVVHRDLKPGNILVNRDGQPKLVDFGIAKLLDPERNAESTPTLAWHRAMTPDYASPEQVLGKPITTASDIYSLGIVLYQLLCGHRPYRLEGNAPSELEAAVSKLEPMPPSRFIGALEPSDSTVKMLRDRQTHKDLWVRRLSGDLDNIVLMALRLEPRRRYASAEQFAEDLERSMTRLPVRARPDTFGYRASRFLGRHRWGVAVAGLITTILLGAGLALLVLLDRIATERDQVRNERDKALQVAHFLERVFTAANPISALEDEVEHQASPAQSSERPKTSNITARDLLDQGASMIEYELGAQPGIQASLMSVIGEAYSILGVHDRSRDLLEAALRMQEESPNQQSLDLAETLLALGYLALEEARDEQAEAYFDRALQVCEQSPEGDACKAESLDGLGEVFYWRAEYELALARHREALVLHRQVYGDHHLQVAESLKKQALVLNQQGIYAEAEMLLHQILEIERQFLPNDHLRIAVSINNLATLRRQQGRLEGVEPLLRESLSIRRQHFEDEHETVLKALSNLADVLWFQGDYGAAEVLNRRNLEAMRRVHGTNHPFVGVALSNLGKTLEHQGKYAEAETFYLQAYEIARSQLGERHPYFLVAQYNLGNIAFSKTHYQEALSLYQSALRVVEEILPSRHFGRANLLQGVGQSKIELGSLEEAFKFLREALDIRMEVYGSDHWRVAESHASIGKALTLLSRFADAEASLKESQRIFAAYAPRMSRKRENVQQLLAALETLSKAAH